MKRKSGMHNRRSRHQGGFIREAVLLFVILTIFGVMVLDILSVYSARRSLKEQAAKAAQSASRTYLDTANTSLAKQAAADYLDEHNAQMVKFQTNAAEGQTWYTVTAQTAASTYVFRYFTHLPAVGDWFKEQLHPVVTADDR